MTNSFHAFKRLERFLTILAIQIGALEEVEKEENPNPRRCPTTATATAAATTNVATICVGGSANGCDANDDLLDDSHQRHVDSQSSLWNWNWCQDEAAFIDYHQNIVLDHLRQHVLCHIVDPILPKNWKELLSSFLKEGERMEVLLGDGRFDDLWSTLDTYFLSLKSCPEISILDTEDGLPQHAWNVCLMQCVILSSPAIVSQLAKYSVRSKECAMDVSNFLQDGNLLQEILYNGGPKNQMYGPMMDIYQKILQASHLAKRGVVSNDIYHRLALATALEHAVPIYIFDTQIVIDPLERYQHYERAYINHELDPYFSALSVLELRMVINCDASNDEIAWCREMLRNYRPDHIFDRNDQWKYCMIVKSDVRYKQPEWAPSGNGPRTYQQLISGGGKCGPRAWFGRFVCKAFGVPTWGVRQPGHAAMSRWSPSGWYICLGGPNWKKSYWENKRGEDFEVDVKARECVESYNVVFWLECFAAVTVDPSQKQFWMNLSKLKKREIAASVTKMQPRCPEPLDIRKVSALTKQSLDWYKMDDGLDSTVRHDACGGNILVLEAGSSITHGSNNKVIFMKSIHQQLLVHLTEDGSISYEIKMNCDTVYTLVVHVVTVHSNPSPLRLQVVNGESKADYVIKIPYTKGYRDTTVGIEIELYAGMNKLRFYRQSGLGLTIEKFELTRLEKSLENPRLHG